jgi:hypothetical protein
VICAYKDKIGRYKQLLEVNGRGASEREMEEVTTGGDERIAFGTMAKGQKKYGSTANNLKRMEEQNAFVYNVQRGDTLQGLSVKFGVSTEQIRRINQLWTNDSLFLRDKLLIPWANSIPSSSTNGNLSSNSSSTSTVYANGTHHEVQSSSSVTSLSEAHQDLNDSQGQSGGGGSICSSITSPGSSKHWTHPLSDSFESEDCFPSPVPPPNPPRLQNHQESSPNWKTFESNSTAPRNGCNSTTTNPTPSGSSLTTSPKKRFPLKDHSEKSAQDFLSRIDTAIASSRNQVKSVGGDENGGRPWVTFESDSESDHYQRSSSVGTSLRTEGRHLRYSLKKLEKTQDELFQL